MTKAREEDVQAKQWAERVREQQGEAAPTPEWENVAQASRDVIRSGRVVAQRGHTINVKTLRRSAPVSPEEEYPEWAERPRTRGECGEERPCPFVSCRYNLYLDVNPKVGSIKLNFPHLEVWEMEESCVLDVVERGEPLTLENTADVMNITRERVRQLEHSSLRRFKQHDRKYNAGLHEHAEDEGLGRKLRHLPVLPPPIEDDEDDDVLGA